LKKAISLLLVTIMMLSLFCSIPAFAAETKDGSTPSGPLDYLHQGDASVRTISSHIRLEDILDYNGVMGNMHIAKWINSSSEDLEFPAYCIDPGLRGVASHGDKKYMVGANATLSERDKKILGIMRAGFPYRTPDQLNLDNEIDAYYATQCAVWHYIKNGDDESTLDVWKVHSTDVTRNTKILSAMKNIYLTGKANPYSPPEINWKFEPVNGDGTTNMVEGDWIVNEYEVISDYPYTEYRFIFWDEAVKQLAQEGKIKVTDADGNLFYQQLYVSGDWDNILAYRIPAGTRLKIWYDKELADQQGTVDFTIRGRINNVEMEFTVAYIGGSDLGNAWQGYAYNFVPFQGDNSVFQYTVNDWSELLIEKRDAKTGERVAGATFHVKGISSDDSHINFSVTASSGVSSPQISENIEFTIIDGLIKIENIPHGFYEISEQSPPPHYAPPDVRTQTVEVKAGATASASVIFENEPYGKLKIKKIDSITGQPMDGVTLRVSNPLTGFSNQYVTKNGGLIDAIDLAEGAYIITEIATLPGYVLSSELVIATVQWGKETLAIFKNEPFGTVIITKVDSITGEHLQGANIMITSLATGQTWDVITGSDGTASVDLPPGEYTVQEKNAPPGYELSACPQTVIVLPGDTSYVKIQNHPFGSMLITKINAKTGLPMPGVRLRVYSDTLNYDKTETTDSRGQIHLTDLKPGDYTITEVATIPGFELSTEVLTRAVSYGKETTVVFKNEPFGSTTVIKVDSVTGEHLPGANIKLTNPATGQTWDLITGADGTATVEDLAAGEYYFQEQNPPPHYELNAQTYPVTVVNGENSSVKIQNNPLGKIEITKIDSLDATKTIAGIKLRVQNTTLSFDKTYTTDAQGKILIEDLLPGDYTISEVATVPGYVLSTATVIATVNYGKTTPVVFKNDAKPYIEILKIDSQTNKPVSNTVFRVTNRNTLQNYTVTTDANGKILIPDVDAGWYDIVEITPPTGYVPDYTVYNVYANIGKPGMITIKNTKMPSLTVLKVDKDTQKLLGGGIFSIEKIGEPSNGPITGSPFTTDADGRIYIPELLPGSYKITEIQAPYGYNISENNSQIIAMVAGQDNSVKFENARQPSFILTKTDSRTGKAIEGTAFSIEKIDNPGKGALTGTPFYTDENGQIIIPNLLSGMYRVTEINPSNGYGLPSPNTWEINIIANQDYNLRVKNTRLPSLVINKIDGLSYKGIPNTAFEVFYAVNGSFYGDVRSLGTFVTNKNGQIVIPNCQPGWYRYTEVRPAPGYAKASNPTRDVFLALGDNAYSGVGAEAWNEMNGIGAAQVTSVSAMPVNAAPVAAPVQAQENAAPQNETAAATPAVQQSISVPDAPAQEEKEQDALPSSSTEQGLTPTEPDVPVLTPTAPNNAQ